MPKLILRVVELPEYVAPVDVIDENQVIARLLLVTAEQVNSVGMVSVTVVEEEEFLVSNLRLELDRVRVMALLSRRLTVVDEAVIDETAMVRLLVLVLRVYFIPELTC